MTNVCVIIPTHNRSNHLQVVLNRLASQKTDIEVIPIVVVDGSTDGTYELLEKNYQQCIVLRGDGNWWYTKCVNAGLQKAIDLNSTFILTLNDDVTFDDFFISNFLQDMGADDKIIGAASFTLSEPCRITFSGVKKLVSWRLKEVPYIPKFSKVELAELSGIHDSINLSGRGMFFKRALINKIGFFDENLVQYGSDTDFSYRAYKAGVKVEVSYNSKIFENEKLTSKGTLYNKVTFKEYYFSLFNKYSVNSLTKSYYYYSKHGTKVLFPFYFTFLFIASIIIYFTKYRKV